MRSRDGNRVYYKVLEKSETISSIYNTYKGVQEFMMPITDVHELTPIQQYRGGYLKRDDLFEVYGCKGGKARAAYVLIKKLLSEGCSTIVSGGGIFSPQAEIVSGICQGMGVRNFCFIPGIGVNHTPVIKHIEENNLSIIKYTGMGRGRDPFVAESRARKFSEANHFGFIPFGMHCKENVEVTSQQVKNIPDDVNRIVVPVGSGMVLSGIVTGLYRQGKSIEVLGIQVGADPSKNIKKYAEGLSSCHVSIKKASVKYHDRLIRSINGVNLDPIYEAKCKEFLQDGDLLWIVGHRQNEKYGGSYEAACGGDD